jgi:hypothetical protein
MSECVCRNILSRSMSDDQTKPQELSLNPIPKHASCWFMYPLCPTLPRSSRLSAKSRKRTTLTSSDNFVGGRIGCVSDQIFGCVAGVWGNGQERRRSRAEVIDPELALLRENRDRSVRGIFLDHLERKRMIFGRLDKEEEEEAAEMFHTKFCDRVRKIPHVEEHAKEHPSGRTSAHAKHAQSRAHALAHEPGHGNDLRGVGGLDDDKEVASLTVLVIHAQHLPQPALLPQGGG